MNAQTTVDSFLAAFARMDLDAMIVCFDADATSFFPTEHHAERLAGRDAIRAGFARVIERARVRGLDRIDLPVSDVQTRNWGDAALVTCHLRDARLGRRSFVLRRDGDAWRIIHLHASNENGTTR